VRAIIIDDKDARSLLAALELTAMHNAATTTTIPMTLRAQTKEPGK
jgi:hypothetical protein